MTQPVADAQDIGPCDARTPTLGFSAEANSRFTDNLQLTFDGRDCFGVLAIVDLSMWRLCPNIVLHFTR